MCTRSCPSPVHVTCAGEERVTLYTSMNPIVYSRRPVTSMNSTCCMSVVSQIRLRGPPLPTSTVPRPSSHVAPPLSTLPVKRTYYKCNVPFNPTCKTYDVQTTHVNESKHLDMQKHVLSHVCMSGCSFVTCVHTMSAVLQVGRFVWDIAWCRMPSIAHFPRPLPSRPVTPTVKACSLQRIVYSR